MKLCIVLAIRHFIMKSLIKYIKMEIIEARIMMDKYKDGDEYWEEFHYYSGKHTAYHNVIVEMEAKI